MVTSYAVAADLGETYCAMTGYAVKLMGEERCIGSVEVVKFNSKSGC